jgi:hypothetical protein
VIAWTPELMGFRGSQFGGWRWVSHGLGFFFFFFFFFFLTLMILLNNLDMLIWCFNC